MELQPINKAKNTSEKPKIEQTEQRSFLSSIFYTWIYPLLKLSKTDIIEPTHTPLLPASEYVKNQDLSEDLKNHRIFYCLLKKNTGLPVSKLNLRWSTG